MSRVQTCILQSCSSVLYPLHHANFPLEKRLAELKIRGRIKTIHTTAQVKSARILRWVLEIWRGLSLLKPHRKTCIEYVVATAGPSHPHCPKQHRLACTMIFGHHDVNESRWFWQARNEDKQEERTLLWPKESDQANRPLKYL